MGNYATKNFLSWVLNAVVEVSEMMEFGRAFHKGTMLVVCSDKWLMKRIGVEMADDSRWMWCKDSWWYKGVDAPAEAEFHNYISSRSPGKASPDLTSARLGLRTSALWRLLLRRTAPFRADGCISLGRGPKYSSRSPKWAELGLCIGA